MSSTIDERIVGLRFDNKQFESGVKESLSTLSKLNDTLDKSVASSKNSLNGISGAANKMDLSGISKGVEAIADRFSTLGIIGMRVIENITDGLMGGLSKAIHSVSDSIVSGGIKRAMNIENAHFQLQGLIDDEKEVQAIMDNAMNSVDQTAYGYDEAAKAASMFAASGLKSGTQMENALRGIAGVAATTNQEYTRVSELFTTIAGKGKIQAIELNRFATLGMNAAAAITDYMNDVSSESVEATDSVKNAVMELTNGMEITEADLREFVHDGEISFEIFSEAMSTSFGEHAKDANKTFTGSMANIRAALARTGAMFISPIIKQDGPFVQFFNAVRIKINEFNKALGASGGMAEKFTNWLNGIISKLTPMIENFKVANTYIHKWGDGTTAVIESANKSMMKFGDGTQKVMTGDFYTPFHAFQDIVYSIVNIFKGLGSVIKPVGAAFKEVFLSFDSEGVYRSIESFRKFTETLKLSEKNSKDLHDAFKGVFDIIKVGITIVTRFIRCFKPLTKSTSDLNDGFFGLIGNVGRALSDLAEMITTSQLLCDVFTKINKFAVDASMAIKGLGTKISEITGIDFKNLGGNLEGIGNKLKSVIHPIEFLKNTGITVLTGLKNLLSPLISGIKNLLKEIYEILSTTNPLQNLVAFINGKMILGMSNSIGKLMNTFTTSMVNTVLASISNLLLTLSGMFAQFSNMEAITNRIKVIAEALLMLAGACFILASINPDDLKRSVEALTVLMAELLGAFVVLNKFTKARTAIEFMKSKSPIKFFQNIGSELLKLAISVGILALAVKALSDADPEKLKTGLLAVTVLLGELVIVAEILSHTMTDRSITKVSGTLLAMSISVLILTKAVKDLGGLDIDTLVKGLLAIGGLLLELGIFAKLADGSKLTGTALAILILSGALKVLVGVVRDLGNMPLEQLAQGVIAIGVSLGIMALVLNGIKEGGVKKAFAAIEMAVAMFIIAKSLEPLSKVPMEGLAAAVIALDGSLVAMMFVLNHIKGIKGAKDKALAAIEMAAAMFIIAKSLEPLTQVNPEALGVAVLALIGVMGVMVFGLEAISKTGPNALSGGLSAIAMAASMWIIAQALLPLAQVPIEGLTQAVIALGLMLIEMTGALILISDTAPLALATSIAVVAMAASMWIVAQALLPLTTVDSEGLAAAVLALGLILAEMTAMLMALSLTGPLSIAAGVAAIAMSAAIWIIANALTQLKDMNPEELDAALKGLQKALLTMSAIMALIGVLSPLIAVGSAALLIAALSLGGAVAILTPAIIKLKDAITSMNDVDPTSFERNVSLIGDTIVIFGKSLKSFGILALNGAAALKGIAEAISKMAPALVMLSTVPGGRIQSVMGSLSAGFSKFGESLKSFGFFSGIGSKALNTLSDSISKMAPALMLLSAIPGEKIAYIMGALGGGFKVFGEALDNAPFWGAKTKAEGINALVDNLPKLAAGILPLIPLDSDKVSSILSILGKAFKDFGTALEASPFFFAKTRAEGIGALIDNISSLAEALPAFMELDADGVKIAMHTIATGFAQFGAALNQTPFFNAEDRGAAIGILVDSIGTLSDGLKKFIELDADKDTIADILSIISTAMQDFGTAISEAPLFNSAERATAISALVRSISTLSNGLKKFIELDADKDAIADILDIISTAMSDFGTAISEAPLFGTEDRATAITTLIDSIYDLVPAIQAFEEIGADDVKTILGAVGESLKDFGKALKASPFFGANERSEAIASLIDSLGGLTTACVELSALDQGVLTQVMGALSGGIRSFGTSLKSYDGEAEGNAQIFAGLVESVTSLAGVDAGALTSTIDAIKQFPTALTQLVSIDSDKLSSFSESMTTLAKDGLKGFIDAFSTQTQQAITAVTTFLTKVTQAMKSKSTLFAEAATKNVGQYLTTIRGKYANATTTGNTLASRVISGITSMTETFYRTGLIQGDRYLSGIKNKYAEAISVGLTLANKVLEGFARAYTGDDNPARAAGMALAQTIIDAMGNLYEKFYKIGANAGQGYVNGLKSKLEEAQRVAAQLASTAASSTAKTQQSRSPSRVFMKLGSYAGEGYVLGILDWAKDAYNAGKELAEAVDNSMEDFDATEPVIRPVVDLTNVIESAGMINSLFSDAIGMTSGLTSTASGTMNRNVLMNSAKEFQNGNNSNAGNNITFNQYNNSPKALSRIEIYRDTKNQLNQLKTAGVV